MNDFDSSDSNLRRLDLMIQRATCGISETEQQELDLLNSSPDSPKDQEQLEATVSAFDLAMLAPAVSLDESIPKDLRDRLLIAAGQSLPTDGVTSPRLESVVPESPLRWRGVMTVAALAASLLLVISGFNPFALNPVESVASARQRLDSFVDSGPSDLINLKWQPIHDENASGRVFWSDSAQEGYMEFDGLDKNDPTVEQYQLWIFDTDPTQATPVDGGVFDISADGKVVVPIRATVPIEQAVQFAVTVERPGGVYVSKRERIPVLAKVGEAE
jgi:hypothetical protein